MQIDSGSNYNPLGRTGPLYPRPEYRPKNTSGNLPEDTKGGGKDKVSVSGQKGEKGKAKAQKALSQAVVADGRLSLQSAKALTKITAESIAELSPDGINQCPHLVQGLGLLAPRYI
ncbi:MAG: hypothetical protein LBU69_06185 [Deltaproteobacteria bacterium]|jgi:hypothetical protein|nr:hypothetical protein [Deltaproteobacteria bacterium]